MCKKLDDALYLRFRQQRERDFPVIGQILLEKAPDLHDLIYPEVPREFNARLGFQYRLCRRFGIKSLAIAGEKLSVDLVSADDFVGNFSNLVCGYAPEQISNCAETGLYYKMLPAQTLATVHNKATCGKKAKESVTIHACANVTGSIKLPLLFIGKSKNPRCFRGINKGTLDVSTPKECMAEFQYFQSLVSQFMCPTCPKSSCRARL